MNSGSSLTLLNACVQQYTCLFLVSVHKAAHCVVLYVIIHNVHVAQNSLYYHTNSIDAISIIYIRLT